MSNHPPHDTDFHIDDELWASYTAEARQEGPMLTPAEIRHHGDRRRRLRRVSVTAAALVVAAAAATAVAFPLLGSPEPQYAGSPSPTSTPATSTPSSNPSVTSPSATPPSASASEGSSSEPASSASDSPSVSASTGTPHATPPVDTTTPEPTAKPLRPIPDSALPNSQQIYLLEPGDMGKPYIMEELGTASDETGLWICDQGILTLAKGMPAKTAIFSNGTVIIRAHLIQMQSAQAANDLATTIRGWNDTCPTAMASPMGKPIAHSEPTGMVDGARVDFSVQQWPGNGEDSRFNGLLVVVKGDRLLIVNDTVIGQDYNAVGPIQHQKEPDVPLVRTATHLDELIAQMMNT